MSTHDVTPYGRLIARLREIGTLHSMGALLSWDQETMMPPSAAPFRADELAMVSTLAHTRGTAPEVGEWIAACEQDPEIGSDPDRAANLREIRRDYDRATKLPTDLVAELTATASRSLEVWKTARAGSDFASFRPSLERLLELVRRKAECLGIPEGGEAYDVLLDEYEPGMTAAAVEGLFDPLRRDLTPLIAAIAESGIRPDDAPHLLTIPLDRQVAFNRFVAERLGYDLDAGRLDVSTHPFTEGLGPGDTRITTRYRDDHFPDALGSTIHETGHALYEQGLPKTEFLGEPRSEAASLGMHESQSRMWENQVGRSLEFWQWALPHAGRILGDPVGKFTADTVFRAMNLVEPSLIRVESDEATYNLHIMLRFDLERALVRGDLAPADLPAAWNDRVKSDLGLDVPDDAHGCLQDIHWSMGAFGYFPTYTLGNLYAAQLWDTIREQVDDLDRKIAAGEFSALLDWLRREIHVHGRKYRAAELCERITGKPLGHEPLVRYLRDKLTPIYGL